MAREVLASDARRSKGYLSIDAGINATSLPYAGRRGTAPGSQRGGFVSGSFRMDASDRFSPARERSLSWVSLSNRAKAFKKQIWTLFSEEDGEDLPLINSIVQVPS